MPTDPRWGLKAPDPLAPAWRPRPFSRQKYDFFQKSIKIMISHHQSIDNNILSYRNKFQPSYGQYMPNYGIIGILKAGLAHNLAKCQYLSMRPSLFDKYYQEALVL